MSQMIYPYIYLKKSHYIFSKFLSKMSYLICLISCLISYYRHNSYYYMTHMLKLIFKTYKKNLLNVFYSYFSTCKNNK